MFSLSFALLLTPILWLVCQFSVGFFFLSSKGTHVIFIFFFYLFFFFAVQRHIYARPYLSSCSKCRFFTYFFCFSDFHYSAIHLCYTWNIVMATIGIASKYQRHFVAFDMALSLAELVYRASDGVRQYDKKKKEEEIILQNPKAHFFLHMTMWECWNVYE